MKKRKKHSECPELSQKFFFHRPSTTPKADQLDGFLTRVWKVERDLWSISERTPIKEWNELMVAWYGKGCGSPQGETSSGDIGCKGGGTGCSGTHSEAE